MTLYTRLKNFVNKLREAKEKVTLSQIMKKLKVPYGRATRVIREFSDKEEVRLQVVKREENIKQWDRFTIPTKTVPTYEVVEKLPLPPAPPEPPPVPYRFEALGLRVDAYTEEEIIEKGKERLGVDADAMKEAIEWWEFTGELEKRDRPPIFPTTYPDVVFIPQIEREQRVEPPKRTWDILELRSYLQDTLGISMRGAMMAEYELRDGLKHVRLRTYRIPHEVGTSFGMVSEVVPPVRRMGLLKWRSHAGWSSETQQKDYKFHHEFNIFLRVPLDVDKGTLRKLVRSALEFIVDDIGYTPKVSLDDILEDWHDADMYGTTTEEEKPDGSWQQLYEGHVQRSGEIPEDALREIYKAMGVIR